MNVVFESPSALHTFSSSILSIFTTKKYFYVATVDNWLTRYEIRSQVKASLNTMQKTQIAKRGLKKIAVVFCKEYLIVALVQNQLYILPESKFHEPFYPTSITNVDDFCACGDENSLRVISGKNFIQYSIQNFKDFLQVSTRELKQSVSQIVSSNVEILFKMKGKNQPQILDMREAKFYDTGKESPRFIGVATGPTGSKTNRLSQRQKVSQFYLVYKDYVEFLRNGPFQRLQAKNNETIIDFKINYPYAIFIFKHFIEVKALVCDNLTLEIPFEPPASKSILCPLPNHSFLYSNDKQLFSVQFVSPTAQIDELTNRKLWENAIALSAAFPDDKTSQSKLNDLYLSYGESLLVQGKFHEAFVNFKNSNKPPSSIVSNFSVLLPYEVTDEKSNLTEWKKKSNTNFSSSMQLDENALVELKNYIKGILEKGCDEETTLMILQSVLFKCYVYVEPNYVIEFIRQKPSIFFDSTEKFLQQKNSDEIFLELCRTYGRNSIAIKFLKDKGLVEELVKYVRMSHDFEKHGKEVFRFVHDKDPKLSPLLFCSNYLDESQVYNILRFIETSAGLKKSEQNIINIKFLDFCIYERKINKNTLNVKLIELYIEILSPSISQHLSALTMNYISIEREPEPIKSYRKGLQKILETCERSDAAAQVDKISDCFLEEKLVAMRRSGMIKNCLQLVSQSIVDFSIALDFCEKVYEEEQNQKDVFTQLFMELISQPNVNENSKKNIIRLVNTKTEFLDIVCVIQRIPSNIKLVEIKEFLKNVTVGMVNHNREKKIENALIQSTLSFKKQQLKYLKGGSVEITHDTLCATCRKPIKFSVFYVLNDNTIIHSACKPPQTDLSMD